MPCVSSPEFCWVKAVDDDRRMAELGQEEYETQYVYGKPCKYGHTSGKRYRVSRNCVECHQIDSQTPEVRARHIAYNKTRYPKMHEWKKKYRTTPEGRARQILQGVSARCKRKGEETDLTYEWALTKLRSGVCELSGLPFDFSQRGFRGPFSPSIDRIDSRVGYRQDNCRLILWALNMAFGPWGEATFREIAQVWISKQNQEQYRHEYCEHGVHPDGGTCLECACNGN